MQTKQVVSEIDFDNTMETLNRLELTDDIQYIRDELGIRALGVIYVTGNYEDNEGIRDFEEYIELDILAPYEKLENYDDFKVMLDSYDYAIINGNLKLTITLNIDGISDSPRQVNKTYYDEPIEEIETEVIETHNIDCQESNELDSTIEIPVNVETDEKEENNFTDEDTPVCTIECGCSAASSKEYEERHKECMEKNREYINPNAFINTDVDTNCKLNYEDSNCQLYNVKPEKDTNMYQKEDINDEYNMKEESKKEQLSIQPLVSNEDIESEMDDESINDELNELEEEQCNDQIEDTLLFDDILDEDICTTDHLKYVICDADSSYESISKKYNIDIRKLMKANNYMVIGDKSIVEIPNE